MKKQIALTCLLVLAVTSTAAPLSAADTKVVSKSGTASKKGTSAQTKGPVKTEAQALAIVSARKEVKEFVAAIKKSKLKGSSSHIEFDRKEGDDFVIHVFEYVPDDEESGHTATFNWYHVNSKSGKVTKEF